MRLPPAKRAFDLVGSLLLLLLLAPALATACAAVAVTSPGGAICRRVRAGLHGTPFLLLSVRTGYADPGAGPPTHAPTPVGRLLHRLALDGLPQLFNVVRGEMSLVGPRPLPFPLPLENSARAGLANSAHAGLANSARAGLARDRLAVLPGMTGLWQVGARSDLPWDEMVLLDLEYVDTHCLAVDLRILARTIPAVLRRAAAAPRTPRAPLTARTNG